MDLKEKIELLEKYVEESDKGKDTNELKFDLLYTLHSHLPYLSRPQLVEHQDKLEELLVKALTQAPGSPLLRLIAESLCLCFQNGKQGTLNHTIITLHGWLTQKQNDTSHIPVRIAALYCIGVLCEGLGRTLTTFLPDNVAMFTRQMKARADEIRYAAIRALHRALEGAGSNVSMAYAEALKLIGRGCADAAPEVRVAAVECIPIIAKYSSLLCTSGMDGMVALCIKGMQDTTPTVRTPFAVALGNFLAESLIVREEELEAFNAQQNQADKRKSSRQRPPDPFETVLNSIGIVFCKSSTSREVRTGLARAYIVLFKRTRDKLESRIPVIVQYCAGILANPKVFSSPSHCIHARACVSQILRKGLGSLLGDKGQELLARALCDVLDKKEANEYILVMALREISMLLYSLGEGAGILRKTLVDPIMSTLPHQSNSVRIAAVLSLRALGRAVPAHLHDLISGCINMVAIKNEELNTGAGKTGAVRDQHLRSLYGHGLSLAAMVASVSECPLGVPHEVLTGVLDTAFALLGQQTEGVDPQIVLARNVSGWALVGAWLGLEYDLQTKQVKLLFNFWKRALGKKEKVPKSEQEIMAELQTRAEALRALHAFILYSPNFSAQLLKIVLTYQINTFKLLASLTQQQHQQNPYANLVKERLFLNFCLLPPSSYMKRFIALMQTAVSEFGAITAAATTLLAEQVNPKDESLSAPECNYELDEELEEGLIDPESLNIEYLCVWERNLSTKLAQTSPSSRVVDGSVSLFSKIYANQSETNRQYLLGHFVQTLKVLEKQPPAKKPAMLTNICSSLLGAIRNAYEAQSSAALGGPELFVNAQEILQAFLYDSDSLIRRAAAESLGMLSELGGEEFAFNLLSYIDKELSTKSANGKSGLALTLGCIHRYSRQQDSVIKKLSTSVPMLHSLTGDPSPEVKTWAMHALWQTIESAKLQFEAFVRPTLSLLYQLILSEDYHPGVFENAGRVAASVVVALAASGKSELIARCLAITSELRSTDDALVQTAAVHCTGQLIVHVPEAVDMKEATPFLREGLRSQSMCLSRSVVKCMITIAQQDATCLIEDDLEAELFRMIDVESSAEAAADLKLLLLTLLDQLSTSNLTKWLDLLKRVILAKSEESKEKELPREQRGGDDDDDDDSAGGNSDNEQGGGAAAQEPERNPLEGFIPAWQTKIFGLECLSRLLKACQNDAKSHEHFDLALAKDRKRRLKHGEQVDGNPDLLVLHLQDLISTAFTASTAQVDSMRPKGMQVLEEVVAAFSDTLDPDFEGHYILEVYQAQLAAALRPAFAPDASPLLTAAACKLATVYIHSQFKSGDASRVTRVLSLLTAPLDSLTAMHFSAFGQHTTTLVQLSFLRAVSEVFQQGGEMKEIIKPFLPKLKVYWIAALRDYAILSTQEKTVLKKTPAAFYTFSSRQQSQSLYDECWPSLMKSIMLLVNTDAWVESSTLMPTNEPADGNISESQMGTVSSAVRRMHEATLSDDFNLLIGFSIKALVTAIERKIQHAQGTAEASPDDVKKVNECLESLQMLFNRPGAIVQNGVTPYAVVEIVQHLGEVVKTFDASVGARAIAVVHNLILAGDADFFETSNATAPRLAQIFVEVAFSSLYKCLSHIKLTTKPVGDDMIQPDMKPVALEDDAGRDLARKSISLLAILPSKALGLSGLVYIPSLLSALIRVVAGSADSERVLRAEALQAIVQLSQYCTPPAPEDGTVDTLSHLRDDYQAVYGCALRNVLNLLDNCLSSADASQSLDLLLNTVWKVSVLDGLALRREAVHQSLCSAFTRAFAFSVAATRRIAITTLRTILQAESANPSGIGFQLATLYVQKLAPEVLKLFQREASTMNDAETQTIIQEIVKLFLLAYNCAPETTRAAILKILLPLATELVSSDVPPALRTTALTVIMHLAQVAPLDFKTSVDQLGPAKTKLQLAVQAHMQGQQATSTAAAPVKAAPAKLAPQNSIKLKMDFSHFKKK